jgi:hypothetical protein
MRSAARTAFKSTRAQERPRQLPCARRTTTPLRLLGSDPKAEERAAGSSFRIIQRRDEYSDKAEDSHGIPQPPDRETDGHGRKDRNPCSGRGGGLRRQGRIDTSTCQRGAAAAGKIGKRADARPSRPEYAARAAAKLPGLGAALQSGGIPAGSRSRRRRRPPG